MNTKKLLKHLPSHISKYVYIGIGVLFIVLIIWAKLDRDGVIKVGDTTIFERNYDREIELPDEERVMYEEKIQKYDDLINGVYTGTDEEIELGAPPQQMRFLQKAFNLSALGRHNEALKTFNEAKEYYGETVAVQELIARTYILAEAYTMAAKTYAEIIEQNPDRYMQYARLEILSYIEAGDDDKAGDLYIEYITAGGAADPEIVNGIRKLRGLDPQ